jgi:hypothetical protein
MSSHSSSSAVPEPAAAMLMPASGSTCWRRTRIVAQQSSPRRRSRACRSSDFASRRLQTRPVAAPHEPVKARFALAPLGLSRRRVTAAAGLRSHDPALGDQQGPGRTVSLRWAVTGYLLVGAAVIVTSGALGDVLGRRRMFLVGSNAPNDRRTVGACLGGLFGWFTMSPDSGPVSEHHPHAARRRRCGSSSPATRAVWY